MTLVAPCWCSGLVPRPRGARHRGPHTITLEILPRLDDLEALVRPGVTRFEAADGQLVGECTERRISSAGGSPRPVPPSSPRMRASSPTPAWI